MSFPRDSEGFIAYNNVESLSPHIGHFSRQSAKSVDFNGRPDWMQINRANQDISGFLEEAHERMMEVYVRDKVNW